MKASRVFWGMLLVSLGTFFLLKNAFEIDTDIFFLRKLWPLIIVLVGLLMMVKQPTVRMILAGAAGMWLGWLVFFVVSFGWVRTILDEEGETNGDEAVVQEFVEPLPAGIRRATFHLSGTVGKFTIDTSNGPLLAARITSRFLVYELDRRTEDGVVHLRLDDKKGPHIKSVTVDRRANRGRIELSTQPDWEMHFEVGAAEAELDLRPFRLQKLSLESGVASIRVRLGAPEKEMHCKFKTGVSTLRVSIPESVGCEIRVDGGLSSKRFEKFQKVNDRVYRTENFATAERTIRLDIDAGISTLRVDRY